MGTFAQGAVRPLLVLHALAAAAVVASSTHQLVFAARYLAGRAGNAPRERLVGTVASVAFAAAFGLGLLLYPTYKLHVRAEFFDRPGIGLGGTARLFDIKEMGALAGLGVAGVLAYLSRRLHPTRHPEAAPLYVGLATLQCLLVWGVALIGLWVTSTRAVAP